MTKTRIRTGIRKQDNDKNKTWTDKNWTRTRTRIEDKDDRKGHG